MLYLKRTVLAALTVTILSFAALAGAAPTRTDQEQVSNAETEQFLVRWNQPRNKEFLSAAMWTMIHDYHSIRRVSGVLTGLQPYLKALDDYQNGEPRSLARLGGVPAFKARAANWLVSPEPSVRAFAALVLGVSGDRTYAARVARLMNNPIRTARDEEPIDRGRAAQALGMMGATEYQERLADFLNSANQYDRVGAVYAFGYLKAKDQELALGRLLYDKNESVRTAVEEALGWMDGPEATR